VLLFSLGMPVMPVDTHIHRIALAAGADRPHGTADAAHPLLTAITPPGRMLEAHLLLIEHGRPRTCKAAAATAATRCVAATTSARSAPAAARRTGSGPIVTRPSPVRDRPWRPSLTAHR
jgi:endonuclease III